MTNKQKAILACEKLAEKYRNPAGKAFASPDACPLCEIFQSKKEKNFCRGCPLANIEGEAGCVEFASYKEAMKQLRKDGEWWLGILFIKASTALVVERRAKFFDELKVELEEYPEEQFTKKGWKYFNISRSR